MRILGIDTSTKSTGLCLFCDGQVEALSIREQERTRAENLLPEMQRLFVSQGLSLEAVDGIAVAVGPGSFTGLRISVTIAKTLAQFSNKALFGISTLAALAQAGRTEGALLCPVIDARADRIFSAAYRWEAGTLQSKLPEGLYYEADWKEQLAALARTEGCTELHWLGVGVQKHPALWEVSGVRVEVRDGDEMKSPVVAVCEMAQQRYAQGCFDSYLDLAPHYLRKSQAEMDRERAKPSLRKKSS